MIETYNITDLLISPIVLLLILIIAWIYATKKQEKHPEYKYYFRGLILKLLGAFSIWYIYTFYYPGGDTKEYYAAALATLELLYKNPAGFFSVWLGAHDLKKLTLFLGVGGTPGYYRDPNSFFVVRVIIPFVFISFKSYLVCAFLLATVSFFGVWKLFSVYVKEYPDISGKFAIALFYVPSVFFWGSGILKDTITFSMVSIFVASFYKIFIRRNQIRKNFIWLIIATYFIISIKPYIFIGLIPGSLFWIINRILSGIRGQIIRFVSAPILILLISSFGYLLLYSMEQSLGHYTFENVLKHAAEVQRDLKSDYYRGNSFDIGDYDPTVGAMLLKAPAAINVALFRPYIWEANNLVMILSSIENMVILLLTIVVLIRTRLLLWVKYLPNNHLLTFSIIFSLFFAFSVGISASNFGSMVRYKIPAIPFFISSCFIIQYLWKKEKNAISSLKLQNTIVEANSLTSITT